jgi:hypothetical protein
VNAAIGHHYIGLNGPQKDYPRSRGVYEVFFWRSPEVLMYSALNVSNTPLRLTIDFTAKSYGLLYMPAVGKTTKII